MIDVHDREPSTVPCLRRRVIMEAFEHHAVAAVEDDFHHFIVTVEHDGTHVTHVTATSPRSPWSICIDAAQTLQRFVGMAISTAPDIDPKKLDYYFQCTHQYDLAGLAIAQAARGGKRQYDIEVPDSLNKQKTARLFRDGELFWEWQLNGSVFIAPERFAGLDLRSIGDWAIVNLDVDEVEVLKVMRRAFMIAAGRPFDLDQFENNALLMQKRPGACFASQPVNGGGKRNKGTQRDFTDRPNQLLQELAPVPLRWR